MTARLRIAVFAYEFPALSETFVLDQVTGLFDLGHEVVVIAERARGEALAHPEIAACDLAGRTIHLDMPANPLVRLLKGGGIAVRMALRDPAGLAHCLNRRRFGRLATSLRLLFWHDRLSAQAPFDVIHAHFGPVGELAARLREAGIVAGRLSTVMHGVDVSAHAHTAPGRYAYLFDAGELFLPVSEVWRERLVALGCPPDRIAVHRMGIDPGRYRFRERRAAPGDPLRLLTVGRLIEKKGVGDALEALAALKRHGVPFEYAIAGDGPLRADLERAVHRLGLSERVTFLGWQDREAVAALMDDADILLAPSVTASDGDQEGIPVTLMEAMAAGMVVLSTRHSGIPELVKDGWSGLLVPEHDVAALRDALALAWKEPERWPAYSRAARRRVCDAFDVAVLNRSLAGRFAALVEGEVPVALADAASPALPGSVEGAAPPGAPALTPGE